MKQRLIEQVGRSTRLRVLNELKRTSAGLAVRDLAARLGMSYMGVKDVCTDLQQRGLLDTWREPSTGGRPRLLYRVTERAHDLFPTASNPLTIDVLHAAQKLFGPSAPEKLLLVAFQARAVGYADKMRGSTLEERAKRLTSLRDAEGCMANCEVRPGRIEIVERHSPILDVLRAFPHVAKLETDLFERVLGVPVSRTEEITSGLFCATFSMVSK